MDNLFKPKPQIKNIPKYIKEGKSDTYIRGIFLEYFSPLGKCVFRSEPTRYNISQRTLQLIDEQLKANGYKLVQSGPLIRHAWLPPEMQTPVGKLYTYKCNEGISIQLGTVSKCSKISPWEISLIMLMPDGMKWEPYQDSLQNLRQVLKDIPAQWQKSRDSFEIKLQRAHANYNFVEVAANDFIGDLKKKYGNSLKVYPELLQVRLKHKRYAELKRWSEIKKASLYETIDSAIYSLCELSEEGADFGIQVLNSGNGLEWFPPEEEAQNDISVNAPGLPGNHPLAYSLLSAEELLRRIRKGQDSGHFRKLLLGDSALPNNYSPLRTIPEKVSELNSVPWLSGSQTQWDELITDFNDMGLIALPAPERQRKDRQRGWQCGPFTLRCYRRISPKDCIALSLSLDNKKAWYLKSLPEGTSISQTAAHFITAWHKQWLYKKRSMEILHQLFRAIPVLDGILVNSKLTYFLDFRKEYVNLAVKIKGRRRIEIPLAYDTPPERAAAIRDTIHKLTKTLDKFGGMNITILEDTGKIKWEEKE